MECIHKDQIVCLNGVLTRISEARISPLDRGFLFGDGLFETIRAESGRLLFLKEHLERLYQSSDVLEIDLNRELPWKQWIQYTLDANNLLESTARIKLLVSRGESGKYGSGNSVAPTTVVYATPCEPPSEEEYLAGWTLMMAPEGFSPPLARHKTLNYLYYDRVFASARKEGYNDAIIPDASGHIAETSRGSLLIQLGRDYLLPLSDHKLRGVTETAVERILGNNASITRQRITRDDVSEADAIYVLNSIVLVMPVREIAGIVDLTPSCPSAELLRQELLK